MQKQRKLTLVDIYDHETLKLICQCIKENIVLKRPGMVILDRPYVVVVTSVIILLSIIIPYAGFQQRAKISELQRSVNVYQEMQDLVQLDISLESLAGKYATSRSMIPKDRDQVFEMVKESNAWYPDIIMAQIIQESAVGTSDIGVNARNLFGMKKVSKRGRPTLQIPDVDYKGYGMYLNWQHSVLDRILWDRWVFKQKPTRDQYLDKLENVYAEDPDYRAKIVRIAKTWEKKL